MEKDKQYLYEYQEGERVRNIGLLKIENQMGKCTMQVYANQMDRVKGILFQKDNGETYLGCWEPELFPTKGNEEVTEVVAKQEDVEEYIHTSSINHEKIRRQDLSRLPRREWRLANNSFLLHGYYNYHHLLYIEENGAVWIGVPGIYHDKEKTAAAAFGFGEFRRRSEVQIELEKEEENVYEDFGYWCRQIPLS